MTTVIGGTPPDDPGTGSPTTERFDTMVDDILAATGGPMTPGERRWADDLLRAPR
ncbi:hypothetical protein [Kineosporia sp. A_224]|uniref:hypothetical protein n=1 Tax=Kineosporia sp. A_224 TaxID=1962180 RepID=UPI0013043689|nr:hypothetical protein [Kineosporia sp. A_224]